MKESELRTRTKALALHIITVCDGIDTRNLPSGHGRPPTNLTPEREAAIREAFQYYGLI